MDGAEHMTSHRVHQLKQFSIVRGSKIKAMTFLSHQPILETTSTFWQDVKELTIKVTSLAPQYLDFKKVFSIKHNNIVLEFSIAFLFDCLWTETYLILRMYFSLMFPKPQKIFCYFESVF